MAEMFYADRKAYDELARANTQKYASVSLAEWKARLLGGGV
jgi:hypothetical protein